MSLCVLFIDYLYFAIIVRVVEDREVPSIVATRRAEDPSQANIQWSSSSPEATEILIYNYSTNDPMARAYVCTLFASSRLNSISP